MKKLKLSMMGLIVSALLTMTLLGCDMYVDSVPAELIGRWSGKDSAPTMTITSSNVSQAGVYSYSITGAKVTGSVIELELEDSEIWTFSLSNNDEDLSVLDHNGKTVNFTKSTES